MSRLGCNILSVLNYRKNHMSKIKTYLKEKKIETFILGGVTLLVILMILLTVTRSSLDDGNVEKKYSVPGDSPVIAAENGTLKFNSVRVSVPQENASYVIGYDWAKTDKEYPTVPSSASASYTDESEKLLYEIVLYRDKVASLDDPEENKTVDTWFDGWTLDSGENAAQEMYQAKNTKGVLIRNSGTQSGDSDNKNCSYTYYFAVEANNSIEQYVLELDYYDSASLDKAEEIFKACADSITVDKGSAA